MDRLLQYSAIVYIEVYLQAVRRFRKRPFPNHCLRSALEGTAWTLLLYRRMLQVPNRTGHWRLETINESIEKRKRIYLLSH